jgi:hypothetical protein
LIHSHINTLSSTFCWDLIFAKAWQLLFTAAEYETWSVVHRPRFFEHVRQQGGLERQGKALEGIVRAQKLQGITIFKEVAKQDKTSK